MLVYHGTTFENAARFVAAGIDAHIAVARKIHGPQDGVSGLFVTPKVSVARRHGLCVIEIEVDAALLSVPPALAQAGATVDLVLAHEYEPQALLTTRVEPAAVRIVEHHPNGYPFNPYERND